MVGFTHVAPTLLLFILEFPDKSLSDNVLRFSPIQIAEWLHGLSEHKFSSRAKLADYVGLIPTRVGQFLYLRRIPGDLRVRLKQIPGLTEGELRPLTKMDPVAMKVAVGRLLGMRMMAKAG